MYITGLRVLALDMIDNPKQFRALTMPRITRFNRLQRPAEVGCLVPVVGGLEGSSDGDIDVGGLVSRQLGELGAQLGKVEGSHFLVQVL